VVSVFSSVAGMFVLEKVASTKLLTDLPRENANGFRSSSNAVEGVEGPLS